MHSSAAGASASGQQPPPPPPEHEQATQGFDRFLSNVAGDVDAFWAAAFESEGLPYRSPTLFVVDRGQRISDPCDREPVPGTLQNSFWCIGDDNVYLFSDWLQRVIQRGSGTFGVAYVVAHEWGHHIQNELHLWRVVARRHIRTIKTETQADCFAGIWAKSAYDRGIANDTDIEQIIAATNLGGDARGTPPTARGAHGRSGLRYAWWKNGFAGGSTDDCRTF